MTPLTRNLFLMGSLAGLLAGCATTPKSENAEVPVFQPEAVEPAATTAAPSPQVRPTYEAVVVEAAPEPEEAGTAATATTMTEAPVFEPDPALVPEVEIETETALTPEPVIAPLSEGESVTRLEPDLPKGAMGTLNEADQLLNLSDAQYNDLVQVLEERTAEWKALLAEKKSLTAAVFEGRKSNIFGTYSKRILDIFTPEQGKIWRSR